MHVPVLGTQPKYIDEAEDREKFDEMLEKLNIKRPKGKAVWSVKEGIEEANKLEYPLLVTSVIRSWRSRYGNYKKRNRPCKIPYRRIY